MGPFLSPNISIVMGGGALGANQNTEILGIFNRFNTSIAQCVCVSPHPASPKERENIHPILHRIVPDSDYLTPLPRILGSAQRNVRFRHLHPRPQGQGSNITEL